MISSTRRRMKARIRIAPISASICTSAETSARSSCTTSPASRDANLKQRTSPGNHVRFARELPWAVARDQMLAVAVTLNDVQLTADDDKTRHIRIACLDKDFAAFNPAATPCAAIRAICSPVSVGNS